MRLRLSTMLAAIGLSSSAVMAQAETLSTVGTPGLVDMPTAEVLEDGEVALTANRFGNISRNIATFQVLPNVFGVFRYSINRDFSSSNPNVNDDLFDRSFDLHYQFANETERRPALAFGLRDFGGTGILSSEYLVATKHFGERVAVTGGLGWGRLAQRDSFDNPLSIFSDEFDTRDSANEGGINTTGQLDTGLWFRGPAALFGGVDYQATDRLSFQLEYSTDAYENEVARDVIDIDGPWNFGLNYDFENGSNLRGFAIGGTTVGLQYSYIFNPANRRPPGGIEEAPLPIPPRSNAALANRDLNVPADRDTATDGLQRLLDAEGITLEGFTASGTTATVRIDNRRFDNEAQAIGRTARIMANVLPAQIGTFVVITQPLGLPNSAVTLQRDDLQELQTHYDGAWLSRVRSQISDAPTPADRTGELADLYPKLSYGLNVYTALSYFDPDDPVRIDIGPQLSVRYAPSPGVSFDGLFRYPLYSTIDDATRRSNSEIQRVRSDAVLYAIESDLEINRLTAEYLFRPGADVFGRVSGGYLENMYAGLSTEMLWYPIDSRLALGVELNYARQRDFDMLFGLQDYDVITGHASAYYDFDNGFLGQIDVGRYLAGDWGATFGLDREFNNGFKIGAYFTLTEVPFEDFGEGSFDKGLRFTVPLSWITGEPARRDFSQTIQPVLRDGGARLSVPNRLYGITRDYRAQNLNDSWGRVFR